MMLLLLEGTVYKKEDVPNQRPHLSCKTNPNYLMGTIILSLKEFKSTLYSHGQELYYLKT